MQAGLIAEPSAAHAELFSANPQTLQKESTGPDARLPVAASGPKMPVGCRSGGGMSQQWNRREFQICVGAWLTASPALFPPKVTAAQASGESSQPSRVVRVTRGAPKLVSPPDVARGEVWRYGLTYPFQVAPRQAAVFCNVRRVNNPGVDFEVGTDVVLFDSLSNFKALSTIPVSRNHEEPNPNSNTPNERAVMVKYPVAGAFVPFGAKRADGTAHSHAGTGFGISSAVAWPLDDRDLDFSPDRVGRRQFIGKQAYGYLELQQYRYDGKTFQVTGQQKVFRTENVSGWNLMERPIRNGIPDEQDLLLAFSARENQRGASAASSDWRCGVSRWRRGKEGWQCIAFSPVTEYGEAFEPSLIRDLDGSLLFTARGLTEQHRCNIRVWRSANQGASWTQILEVLGPISMSPISINQAADGTPYIGANLYEVPLFPIGDERYNHSGYNTQNHGSGRQRFGGWLREKLVLWPLSKERTRLESPIIMRDCRGEFGPPPGGSSWHADHPSSMVLQLAGGKWHNIVGYRVLERAEATHAISASAHSGAFLEEVISAGPARPAWNF
jgi:hypothetical protein